MLEKDKATTGRIGEKTQGANKLVEEKVRSVWFIVSIL